MLPLKQTYLDVAACSVDDVHRRGRFIVQHFRGCTKIGTRARANAILIVVAGSKSDVVVDDRKRPLKGVDVPAQVDVDLVLIEQRLKR